MNIVHLIGFLGADPEERFTPDGKKVWNLRLATRSYKKGQEETIWWRLTVWGDQQDRILSHLKKGKPVFVIGEMNKLDTYTDKNGQVQVSYDATVKSLHFLPGTERQDSAQEGGFQTSQSQQQYQTFQQQGNEPSFGGGDQQQPAFSNGATQGAGQMSQNFSSSMDEPLPF